ncbi:hypothetical protein C8R44DRAFT_990593 [Mycena epipterygia]|nr:hypothetical protein C8R44DRAFT_990593 [Mycena epipterygia]
MATSVVRNKIGRAAIGVWAQKNRRRWYFREWKFRVEYREPTLTWKDVYRCLQIEQLRETILLYPLRGKYHLAASGSVVSGPQGSRFGRSPQLRITQIGRDPEEDKFEVSPTDLPRRERLLLGKYYSFLSNLDAPRQRTPTATWATLMADLVGNPLDLPLSSTSSYTDADTIPSALDNPPMQIHFSDLISCGVVLGMELRSSDLHRPAIHMTGAYCNIISQEQGGVGVIARYTCKPNHVHEMQTCLPTEIHTLVSTAKGYLRIGDAGAHMTDWGYNSVDALFAINLRRAATEDWCQMSVMDSFRSLCEGDADIQWRKRWSQPATTRVGFLLTHCGNPAVANSFPHSLLQEWNPVDRNLAGQRACHLINQGVGFIDSPPAFCSLLHAKHVVRNSYKLANNWGAEHGGIRGWAMSSGAEFVKRASECWIVPRQAEEVPILPDLRRVLEEGDFGPEWGRKHSAKSFDEENKRWMPTAETLCWIEIMMLDSWIARRVDLMILGQTDEASVPVDSKTAKHNAFVAMGADDEPKGKTTGWKRSRSSFIRQYLARLADGGIRAAGWEQMPVGWPDDWAVLDAVLSLRAVLMATRFELLYNTDIFLKLQEFDPMIRMA